MNHQSGSRIGMSSTEGTDRGGFLETVVLNRGSDDQLECQGYCRSACGTVLYYLLAVLTLGLILLVLYWKPEWKVWLTKSRCPIGLADTIIIKDMFEQTWIAEVHIKDVDYSRTSAISTGSVSFSQNGGIFLDQASDLTGVSIADNTRLLAAGVNMRQGVFIKYFDHHHVRYLWDKDVRTFVKLRGLDSGVKCSDFHERFHGLSTAEQAQKADIYGDNSINIEVKSYGKLFVEEVLNPFYIFQICSVILWMADNYYIYAACIILISAISMGISLYETRRQSITLREMVAADVVTVTVYRGGEVYEEVSAKSLVPGDVIVIPAHGCTMSCDAVLLVGNVIVNESMLTGESVPVTKTPLHGASADELYSPDIHKRHTLFCGTHVIQTRYYGDQKVTAVVVRTGFSTAKGELVRAILFPKPMGFKFYKDSMRFIGVLAVLATVGMCYSITILVIRGTIVKEVILRALDIITIVVPPALPAAMTVGTVYAQNRLKKKGIFCISPPRINICGKLKLICFDKTGTLTEDGLDLWGVVPLQGNRFLPAVQDPTQLPSHGPFLIGMATCHSLTMINGELTGDPLDLKMFAATRWLLEEPGRDTSKFDAIVPTIVKPTTMETYYTATPNQVQFEVGIVRQFTFTSTLQRMSVITRTLGSDHMEIYCKGAPEKIASLCKPNSLPEDFQEVLHQYTMRGFRVIALAYCPLDPKVSWHQAQRIPRDQIERDLHFLGLMVMENAIKPETTPVIHELNDADIRTVMVTGDNILTAVSVAYQCGMVAAQDRVVVVNAFPPEHGKPARIEWDLDSKENVDTSRQKDAAADMELYQAIDIDNVEVRNYHFAVTGRSFAVLRQYFPELLPRICVKGTVFARMGPDQKSQLVEHLQDLSYCVGMCGDGANDCGALKTADVGISLSEAEASVASPLTSKTPNIKCVPTVIREGRAALTTSFGVFKYMALYSMVQFVSVLILYTFETNLGDWMFLYIDLVITTTVAVLMGHTGAYHSLVRRRPMGSLVSPVNIFSILLNVLVVIGFQTGTFMYLVSQPWFEPVKPSPTADTVKCYETTVVFCVSSFQYIILAFCFSRGPPYRKPVWTNVPFLLAVIFLTGLTTLLLLHPFSFFENILQMKHLESFMFKLTVFGLVSCNFFLVLLIESFIIPSKALAGCMRSLRRKKLPKNKYKSIQWDLQKNTSWPPVGEVTMATHGLLDGSTAASR